MTSLKFSLCLTCLCLWRIAPAANHKSSSSVRQDRFMSANVGGSVTLQCFYEGKDFLYWYKQTLGRKPTLMSYSYKHKENGTFYDEFRNNPRFMQQTRHDRNELTISNLRISDSATYFCVTCDKYTFEFAEGITVSVKGSGLKIPALVRQPGGSETLNCTVHTGSYDGEHRVYWFKTSEESHPGLIYTHGGRTDQSERESNTQTHTCVYHLPMKSLNVSDAETFDCAVVSCGHMLFRDRTKLDFKANEVTHPDPLVYFLSGALVLTTILIIVLTFSVLKANKESQRASPSTTTEGHQDGGNLHYAALRHYEVNRSRRQRDDTETECVYSSVRQ